MSPLLTKKRVAKLLGPFALFYLKHLNVVTNVLMTGSFVFGGYMATRHKIGQRHQNIPPGNDSPMSECF